MTRRFRFASHRFRQKTPEYAGLFASPLSWKSGRPHKTLLLVGHRWRVTLLVILLVVTYVALSTPLATVRGLEVNTGITVAQGLWMDAARIAFLCWVTTGPKCGPPASGPPTHVGVYDTVCRFNAATGCTFFDSFPLPTGTSFATTPMIYCDTLGSMTPPSGCRIVIATATTSTFSTSFDLYYCDIPAGYSSLVCTTSWILITTVSVPFFTLLAWGGPAFNRDIVVFPVSGGFSYFRFSTAALTTVATGTQPAFFSTNGAVIALTGHSSPGSPPTIMYYDTANLTPTIRDTGIQGYGTSISQYTIAFNDNSTGIARIGNIDIVRNVKNNLQFTFGPRGTLAQFSQPAVWDDRIVYTALENEICDNPLPPPGPGCLPSPFDCNGNTVFVDPCLQWWNLRNTGPYSYVRDVTRPQAAEPLHDSPVIYDNIIAYRDQAAMLRYLVFPLKGDVDLDGFVDIVDIANAALCYNRKISNTTNFPVC